MSDSRPGMLRYVVRCSMLLALASCGVPAPFEPATSTTGTPSSPASPTTLAPPNGGWTLVAVNGAPLPFTIGSDAQIVAGDLELTPGGLYIQTMNVSSGVAQRVDSTRGQWDVDGTMLEFRPEGLSTSVVAGSWDGQAVTILDSRTLKYLRRQRSPR